MMTLTPTKEDPVDASWLVVEGHSKLKLIIAYERLYIKNVTHDFIP